MRGSLRMDKRFVHSKPPHWRITKLIGSFVCPCVLLSSAEKPFLHSDKHNVKQIKSGFLIVQSAVHASLYLDIQCVLFEV